MHEHTSQYQENGYVFLFNILGDIVDCMLVVVAAGRQVSKLFQ